VDTTYLWEFLPRGYLMTIGVETPILLIGLSRVHPVSRRLLAGLWLTACSYPIVVLVLPCLISIETDRGKYLLVAETFAPLSECLLFWAAFIWQRPEAQPGLRRDMITIVLANLASFGIGELASLPSFIVDTLGR
jgi:hypothetical protein